MFLTPSSTPCWTIERTPKIKKTSATLHGNAPAKNGTSAALHGNAFRVFMVQLGASKSSPCDRTKPSFSNHFFDHFVLRDPLGGRSGRGHAGRGAEARHGRTYVRRNGGRRPDHPGNAPRKKIYTTFGDHPLTPIFIYIYIYIYAHMQMLRSVGPHGGQHIKEICCSNRHVCIRAWC